MLERFAKVEGLGNDFLLLDRRDASPAVLDALVARLRAAAPALCDRRLGVGGDGILVVGPPRTAEAAATMIVVNHDGSRPEMCGNGLRCVALAVAGAVRRLVIDTDAGPKPCAVREFYPGTCPSGQVAIDMGPPDLLGPRRVGDRSFAAVSMGNPHAIAFVTSEDPEALARGDGPSIERDPQFPGRTNVEFARVEADGSITLWVWERGCGITSACGTGACATLAAAIAEGLAPHARDVVVRLPGGPLVLRQDRAGGSILMTGPARVAFVGEVEVPAASPAA
ncbi:diaminopimelate epimerase [Nannocystis exedens]|uniref:Diaminopimelate epimerase n=1 Tax=Nannocystis exedens TaxID=54 RepID=A0A1I1TE23_9BACT|nr:diaminopimelate epimerase [Nannocystis exedens]PCC66623.1 Diaminopimelate epimerase [Nannocystis exedens]SFD56842.1 diaminopimelate epimerase [Nannocystis exedens]